jgi:NADPH2:quinone reductase
MQTGQSMRAMVLPAIGSALEPAIVPRPVPGPGEVLVRVHACGINFADTLLVAGTYQEKPPLPFAPGLEFCGTVTACGPDADTALDGRRIAAFAGSGGLAEYALARADACVPLPGSLPDNDAAGFLIAFGTSHLALEQARLRPGERLLVLGAAGGVGLTAVEIGALMGAEVIASARGASRLQAARDAGAHHLIDSDATDLRTSVKALGGADVVYDPVGGAQFDAALRATNPGGRLIPIGFASGSVPQIPANLLLVKNLTVIGFYWGGWLRLHPAALRESCTSLFGWHAAGRLRPHVSHVLPLDRANEALDLLRTRAATGKVVVTI